MEEEKLRMKFTATVTGAKGSSVMQFGGKFPWWDKDQIEVDCPDRYNTVSLRLEKRK